MASKELEVMLTETELAEYLKVHRTTLWRWRSELKAFPKPVRLGRKLIRWKKSQIDSWLSR